MIHMAFWQLAVRIKAIGLLIRVSSCLLLMSYSLVSFSFSDSSSATIRSSSTVFDTTSSLDSTAIAPLLEASMHQDTTISAAYKKQKKQKKIDTAYYSPKKAAIWGASFPGLGQVYNKRYWKLPIVYGLLGTVTYFVASNGKKLRQFNGYLRNAYEEIPVPAPYTNLSIAQLESYRNTYRRNVQLAAFGTVFVWGLSIVDAVVDAHMRSFDISDNLSIKIQPKLGPYTPQNYTAGLSYYTGLAVHLNIK